MRLKYSNKKTMVKGEFFRLWPWLLTVGLLGLALGTFALLRQNAAAMDSLYHGFTGPYHRLMARLTGPLPFSLAEPLTLLFALFCVFFLVHAFWALLRRPSLPLLCKKLLQLGVIALGLWTGFSYLWGVCYYVTPLEEKLGLTASPVSVQALEDTTALYARAVNAAAPLVARNALGEMVPAAPQILALSDRVYRPIGQASPCFDGEAARRAKPLFLSQGMSSLNYTGIFFPFTGESNVNIYTPAAFLPSTIAHELAHSQGIGPEQSANLAAILACAASDLPEYRYSGALLGYLHLSNALYSAKRDSWREIQESLSPHAQADLAANNAYWADFQTPAAELADSVYENFLQGFDQELGLKSYGAVVDLLVAYHSAESIA